MEMARGRWCELTQGRWKQEPGFGVYVIELGSGAVEDLKIQGGCSPGFPVLYVGQSFHSAERRMWVHFCDDGSMSSRLVKKHGRFLRYDLFKHLPRFPTREDAEREEQRHARRLAKLGFHTRCDGTHTYFDKDLAQPDAESEAMRGFDHLKAVEDYVDQAIFSAVANIRVRAASPDMLIPREVAKYLRAAASGSVDPSSEVEGRFAYMRRECVEERINQLLSSGFLGIAADGGLSFGGGGRIDLDLD